MKLDCKQTKMIHAKIKTKSNYRNLNGTIQRVSEIKAGRVSCFVFLKDHNKECIVDFTEDEVELIYTEFDAMGRPVPPLRQQKTMKIIENFVDSNEEIIKLVSLASERIERNQPFNIVGKTHFGNELDNIDLTGRYILLSSLLTD